MNEHIVKSYEDELNTLTAECARMGGLTTRDLGVPTSSATSVQVRGYLAVCVFVWRRGGQGWQVACGHRAVASEVLASLPAALRLRQHLPAHLSALPTVTLPTRRWLSRGRCCRPAGRR